jgi:Flp pilus assembly pilin Flp
VTGSPPSVAPEGGGGSDNTALVVVAVIAVVVAVAVVALVSVFPTQLTKVVAKWSTSLQKTFPTIFGRFR